MAVPEAAMDQDYRSVFRQADVWLAGQIAVQTVAKATGVQRFSDQQFGLGVLAANAGHHPAAGRRINDVSQRLSCV